MKKLISQLTTDLTRMKTLIDFFVDRYKATFTFLTFILVWGFTSIIQLPASAYSDINIPYVFVSTFYDGVSAQDAERLVTRPLEQKLDFSGVSDDSSSKDMMRVRGDTHQKFSYHF